MPKRPKAPKFCGLQVWDKKSPSLKEFRGTKVVCALPSLRIRGPPSLRQEVSQFWGLEVLPVKVFSLETKQKLCLQEPWHQSQVYTLHFRFYRLWGTETIPRVELSLWNLYRTFFWIQEDSDSSLPTYSSKSLVKTKVLGASNWTWVVYRATTSEYLYLD